MISRYQNLVSFLFLFLSAGTGFSQDVYNFSPDQSHTLSPCDNRSGAVDPDWKYANPEQICSNGEYSTCSSNENINKLSSESRYRYRKESVENYRIFPEPLTTFYDYFMNKSPSSIFAEYFYHIGRFVYAPADEVRPSSKSVSMLEEGEYIYDKIRYRFIDISIDDGQIQGKAFCSIGLENFSEVFPRQCFLTRFNDGTKTFVLSLKSTGLKREIVCPASLRVLSSIEYRFPKNLDFKILEEEIYKKMTYDGSIQVNRETIEIESTERNIFIDAEVSPRVSSTDHKIREKYDINLRVRHNLRFPKQRFVTFRFDGKINAYVGRQKNTWSEPDDQYYNYLRESLFEHMRRSFSDTCTEFSGQSMERRSTVYECALQPR